MILSDLVIDSYLAYKGKVGSAPVAGSEKYNRILRIANRKQREWAQDSNIDWPSRFEIRPLGNLTSGNQTYDLDDDILRASDYVYLISPTRQRIPIGIIKAPQASRYIKAAYVTGFNPKQLTFVNTIDSSFSGYTISLACYTMPADMTTAGSKIAVDDPQWLIYAVAAELARNDFTKEEQFGNLIGQANELYKLMLADAQNSSFGQPNAVANLMPQVGSLDYNQFSGYGVN